jgi:hypothetical protein
VDGQRTVEGEDAALAAVTDGSTDLRRVAVTEEELPGIPATSQSQRGSGGVSPRLASAGEARLVGYGRDEAVVEVDAERPALLVLTDVHFPGWKATVDGRDAEIERVDYLLRGVQVPAGSHTVELSYEPASWRAGWIVSALALLAIAGLALLGLRRRRP